MAGDLPIVHLAPDQQGVNAARRYWESFASSDHCACKFAMWDGLALGLLRESAIIGDLDWSSLPDAEQSGPS